MKRDSGRSSWLGLLPLCLSLAVGAFFFLPRVSQHAHLSLVFATVPGVLVVWQLVLWRLAARSGRRLTVEVATPVRQHYIQAGVQLCLYLYWGYWWHQDGVRPIYVQAPLIVAQFLFVYAFDGLWAWTRGRAWRLSSGPAPIVMSTNLFIWFRDDWFEWQFVMLIAGLLGKDFLKWQKDGRRTHIFNPSGFGLACAATVLIATGNTDLTWAKPLATTIEVPHVFLFLFGLGLIVQHFFAITLMTFAAAVVMVVCNFTYTEITGVYLFGSSNLPAAAFLGLHLLMTDPSTSPRTNVGRMLFGAAYGLGYVIAFELLGRLGAPELFAKLYPVPVLNCCVQWLDRLARSGAIGRLNERWSSPPPRRTNLIHMGLWSAVFFLLWGTGYVGGPHPGDSIPFWKRAVAEHKHDAERKLVMVAGSRAIGRSDADAYNELGILSLSASVDAAGPETRQKSAAHWFGEAAARGSREAHENIAIMFLFLGRHRSDEELARALQRLEQDAGKPGGERAAWLLAVAYETGGARPQDPRRALELYRRCGPDDVLAQKGIARLGLLPGSVIDLTAAAAVLERAAAAGDGESCFYLAHMHASGRGVVRDAARAQVLWQRARELQFAPAGENEAAAGLPPFTSPRRRSMEHPPWATAFAALP